MTVTGAAVDRWICPFCPLACDHLGVRVGAASLELAGGECERAVRGLRSLAGPAAGPSVDGRPVSLDEAISAAAMRLGASRQPLFAGLGTDVAGARALYPLACATGAICDSAGGDPLMQGLRALQDRGQFTTTLAEVRTRADMIVILGPLPLGPAPLLRERLGIGDAQVPARHIVVLGPGPGDEARLAAWAGAGVTVESIALEGDLFDALAWLGALLAPRTLERAPAPLRALAERLAKAVYAVIVGAPPALPAHSALLIEAVHRIVGQLNRKTRAAALWMGGGNGAATANQVFAWLSGLPLRSRAGPRGLEHEPLLFGAARQLAQGAVDSLLWVSCFDAETTPPATALPLVALAHPGQASACTREGAVFIPVTTPGVGSAGHVFRTDGTVLMPLTAPRPDGLPTVAEVAARLAHEIQRRAAA